MSSAKGRFVWDFEAGYGQHIADPMEYDQGYFENYIEMDATEMGQKLTQARVDFVAKYYGGPIVDIGIGAGNFVLAQHGCHGFDVNQTAIDWLHERGLWQNPYDHPPAAITCWDSLEHISNPGSLVSKVSKWVFVSMPIYKDLAHVVQSKHFKPHEHLWYWTDEGFKEWMRRRGFGFCASSKVESELGREGITTYAFRRI